MTIEQTISSITSLPLEDQLRIVQTVWDRMSANAGTPLSDSQRVEFDRRVEAYRANPETGLSESELREQIRNARS
jgi:putative addiction module component (TIGR02574 family)